MRDLAAYTPRTPGRRTAVLASRIGMDTAANRICRRPPSTVIDNVVSNRCAGASPHALTANTRELPCSLVPHKWGMGLTGSYGVLGTGMGAIVAAEVVSLNVQKIGSRT